ISRLLGIGRWKGGGRWWWASGCPRSERRTSSWGWTWGVPSSAAAVPRSWPSTASTPDRTTCSSRRTRPTGRNTQQMSNAMKLTMPRFDGAPVLVVGDVMLDRYWHGPSERISPEAPVPVIRVDQIEDRPGGAGNVALNIAALGA